MAPLQAYHDGRTCHEALYISLMLWEHIPKFGDINLQLFKLLQTKLQQHSKSGAQVLEVIQPGMSEELWL